MSTAKSVAGIVPGVMSVGLLGESLKMLPTKKELKEGKIKPKKIIKTFTTVVIGVPLIGTTASMVNKLP